MTLQELVNPFPWTRYSKKLAAKIEHPRNGGIFKAEDAEQRGVHLATGSEGNLAEGNCVRFYWLVDRDDGLILDAKFQVFGQSALIGAADAACELIIGKNYDQAKRVSADLLDRHLRDRAEEPAFPKETYPLLNLCLGALETASEQCNGIPFADTYVAPPVPSNIGETVPGGYPGWKELTLKQKIAVIEEILNRDVRPYIALDAGGIEVLNLLEDKQVIIAYQGSCTSCYSSIGTTLSYIQQILRAKVHPDLVVIPDLDFQNL
ncbi:MAG: iron-sulfur cluster assembly scaffold protein [Parachlamydia sp.]|nr:iron-sulfur cluster assembly scaffold protein [Parachlamydia sp.]